MALPLRLTFSSDRTGTALVFVNEPTKSLALPLPERPKKVELNADNSVLARMKRR